MGVRIPKNGGRRHIAMHQIQAVQTLQAGCNVGAQAQGLLQVPGLGVQLHLQRQAAQVPHRHTGSAPQCDQAVRAGHATPVGALLLRKALAKTLLQAALRKAAAGPALEHTQQPGLALRVQRTQELHQRAYAEQRHFQKIAGWQFRGLGHGFRSAADRPQSPPGLKPHEPVPAAETA